MITRPPIVKPTGATSFLLEFGETIDKDLSSKIGRFVSSLPLYPDSPFLTVVPSYTTAGITIDPKRTTVNESASDLIERWNEFISLDVGAPSPEGRITIPMVYGGEMGPDISEVAQHLGMTVDDVVRKHSEADYLVAAVGFTAGFAFLLGLPRELATPRRSTPRSKVPAGSLGIGGAQTGVYPVDCPGGWNLIGKTPSRLFDPHDNVDIQLRVGDHVQFQPIDVREFQMSVVTVEPVITEMRGDIEIDVPGLQTSIQDLGRLEQARIGVAPSGAMDKSALIAGNRLLHNSDDCAAIEWALLPPKVSFHARTSIVVTGADAGWMLDDDEIAIGQVVEVVPGGHLQATRIDSTFGARGYICVRGGIDVPVVLGSRSLDDLAQFGGGMGRFLMKGDLLPVGNGANSIHLPDVSVSDLKPEFIPQSRPFRVIRGPQAERFNEATWDAFLKSPFTVDSKSNRMGARLNGPSLVPETGADVISEPNATGVIQVPESGQPIVLLAGRATIGGYTKIATVIEADHDRLGQLRPGDRIRFELVDLEDATKFLEDDEPSIIGGVTFPLMEKGNLDDSNAPFQQNLPKDGGMNPDDLIRLFKAAADTSVTSFTLDTDSMRLSFVRLGLDSSPEDFEQLDVQQRYSVPAEPATEESNAGARAIQIRSPLIGTFYRRSAPQEQPYCEVGEQVTEESTIGVIEVMKTFQEVPAGHAGTVSEFLVEDGSSVEFGQVLLEILPLDGR